MKLKILFFLLVCTTFITEAQADIQHEITVAQDGSGDYTSIQAAIDATKAFPPQRVTIFIKNGIYNEKVRVPAWNTLLSLIGEDAEKTIITYNDHFKKIDRGRNSTFFTYTLLVEANDFYAENLTIENTAGMVGQAVALHIEGSRCVFKNCNIKGHQDTLYAGGEESTLYFSNCLIEGTTDFIFGAATALFKSCVIISKKDSYITAASTGKGKRFGFVFIDCTLKAWEGVKNVYLGRPWRPYAKTVFIRCSMEEHINPNGWKEWSNTENTSTTFYAEYNNAGPGSNTECRVSWSYRLSKKAAKEYLPENILGKWVLGL